MKIRRYITLILLLFMGGLFSSSIYAVTCPATFQSDPKHKHKVLVPDGWCWAPNAAKTTKCYRVINLKKLNVKSLQFSAAIWSNAMEKGNNLRLRALCYYRWKGKKINEHVLYKENFKRPLPPVGGRWERCLIGWCCNSPNPPMSA